MTNWYEPKNIKDIMHYLLVYSVILTSWVPVMNFWKNDVVFTSLTVLFVFYIADKIAHKVLNVG